MVNCINSWQFFIQVGHEEPAVVAKKKRMQNILDEISDSSELQSAPTEVPSEAYLDGGCTPSRNKPVAADSKAESHSEQPSTSSKNGTVLTIAGQSDETSSKNSKKASLSDSPDDLDETEPVSNSDDDPDDATVLLATLKREHSFCEMEIENLKKINKKLVNDLKVYKVEMGKKRETISKLYKRTA